MWRMTPSRQALLYMAPRPPPPLPLKSALRRRPGDMPAVLPARAPATAIGDDDSDEMGYEGDAERNGH